MKDFEDKSDWREVLFLPNGVFLVSYHRLTVKALKGYRSRLLNESIKLRREIGRLREKIKEKKAKLEEIESMLNKLTDDKIREIIEKEEQRKREAERKATEFLREYIGEEAFEQLEKKGYFEFTGADGKQYRITKDGRLCRKFGKYWHYMCVLYPEDLPLLDIIASVFTAVKNDPTFSKSSQKLEEVRNWE